MCHSFSSYSTHATLPLEHHNWYTSKNVSEHWRYSGDLPLRIPTSTYIEQSLIKPLDSALTRTLSRASCDILISGIWKLFWIFHFFATCILDVVVARAAVYVSFCAVILYYIPYLYVYACCEMNSAKIWKRSALNSAFIISFKFCLFSTMFLLSSVRTVLLKIYATAAALAVYR